MFWHFTFSGSALSLWDHPLFPAHPHLLWDDLDLNLVSKTGHQILKRNSAVRCLVCPSEQCPVCCLHPSQILGGVACVAMTLPPPCPGQKWHPDTSAALASPLGRPYSESGCCLDPFHCRAPGLLPGSHIWMLAPPPPPTVSEHISRRGHHLWGIPLSRPLLSLATYSLLVGAPYLMFPWSCQSPEGETLCGAGGQVAIWLAWWWHGPLVGWLPLRLPFEPGGDLWLVLSCLLGAGRGYSVSHSTIEWVSDCVSIPSCWFHGLWKFRNHLICHGTVSRGMAASELTLSLANPDEYFSTCFGHGLCARHLASCPSSMGPCVLALHSWWRGLEMQGPFSDFSLGLSTSCN